MHNDTEDKMQRGCRDGKFENRAASLRDLAVYILAVSPASHIAISDVGGVWGGRWRVEKAKGNLV